MLIIAGHLQVSPDSRDAYVAAFAELVTRARRAPGCLDAAITADPVDPSRVYNYERWKSWDHVKAWRAVANAPDPGIPIVDADVQAYEISAARAPFD